jgi:hypothetical protein
VQKSTWHLLQLFFHIPRTAAHSQINRKTNASGARMSRASGTRCAASCALPARLHLASRVAVLRHSTMLTRIVTRRLVTTCLPCACLILSAAPEAHS